MSFISDIMNLDYPFVRARDSHRIAELIFKILTATGSGYPLGVERCIEKEVTNCEFEPKEVRGVWVRCARDKRLEQVKHPQ
jgi:hypothetical protein